MRKTIRVAMAVISLVALLTEWLKEKSYSRPAEPWKQENLIAQFKREQLAQGQCGFGG